MPYLHRFTRFLMPVLLFGAVLAKAEPLQLQSQPLTQQMTAALPNDVALTNAAREVSFNKTVFASADWPERFNRFSLQLSDSETLTFQVKRHSLDKTTLLWHGKISEYPNSQAALVISEQGISGSMRFNGRLWQLRRQADGRSILFETDPALLRADDSLNPAMSQRQLQQNRRAANTSQPLPAVNSTPNGFTADKRLQVMVYYDINELKTYPDLLQLIDLEFQQANDALLQSGVDAQLSAVVKLPVSRQNASQGMLSLMLNGTEMFSNLARDRQHYQADLVHYFGLNLDQVACGLAYLSAFPSGEAYADWALGATNSSCLGNLTFAHEIGHNFGAKHDRHVQPDADQYFNYGYVDLVTSSKTIMAYSDLCDENGKYCDTLAYFSNPNVQYQQRPLGIAAGEPEAANNSQMLNFSALTLANYAGSGAPAGLIASNNSNASSITLNWQVFPGASYYHVYRSDSCRYDAFKTLIGETTTTTFTDQTQGNYCYFVQAFNQALLAGAQASSLSLPESGFSNGPIMDKLSNISSSAADQTVAVSFSSPAFSPQISIVQHDLPWEPSFTVSSLGSGRYQLNLQNDSFSNGSAIVRVQSGSHFEVFTVTFSGNTNQAPVISAPARVELEQQGSIQFSVNISDDNISASNPAGINVQAEDSRLLPRDSLQYAIDYNQGGASLNISIDLTHKFFGTTAILLQLTDGEHLVSQRIEIDITRVLNNLPVVPQTTTLYLDGAKPLRRLLPAYDADNDSLQFSLLNSPSQGQLSLNGQNFTYTADTDFSGDDSFSYRVTETYSGESFDATVTVQAKPQQHLLPKQKLVSNIASQHFMLTYSGQIWAWGSNDWKIFNDSSVIFQKQPTAVLAALWADIDVSDTTLLLIHQDGSLWRLGHQTQGTVTRNHQPQRVGQDNDWKSIVHGADGNRYCQLLTKQDNSLWASGSCSELFEAGLIASAEAAASLPVQISALYHWQSGSHSQIATALIDTAGDVWTGAASNFSRYAGREAVMQYLAKVGSGLPPIHSVYASDFRTFALGNSDLFAWGSLPDNAPWQWQNYSIKSAPVQLNIPPMQQLSVYGNFVLLVNEHGELWTAGGYSNNDFPNGALGRGDFPDRGLAKVDTAEAWNQVFAAESLSFGLNSKGQLLVAGQYDFDLGIRPPDITKQVSTFTAIADFDLKALGYSDTDNDGLADYLETDADNDTLPDAWELRYGLNRQNAADAGLDSDSDGLSNMQEFTLGSNPTAADSDNDGMPDGWELQYGFNLLSNKDAAEDADNDQLSNQREFALGTLPNNPDTDADGMPDGWEVQYNLNPKDASDAASDNDNDGRSALQEYQAGTNPNVNNNPAPPAPPAASSSGGSMPLSLLLLLLTAMLFRRQRQSIC